MKLSKEDIEKFAKENSKYIISIVALVLIIIVLATCTSKDSKKGANDQTEEIVAVDNSNESGSEKNDNSYKKDAYPEVNELVNKYFIAAAAGDVETLKTLINPFDEQQQNLITQLSQYIESYNNISCYTKIGPVENSYVVSVYHDTKFKDINTMAPGLTTLYIHKNDSGVLFIDNRSEKQLEPEVIAFNEDFKAASDVVELKNSVDAKAQEALASDANLKAFVEGTYQQIYVNFYAALNNAAQAQAAADAKAAADAQAAADAKAAADAQAAADAAAQATAKTQAAPVTVYATDMVNIRKDPSTDAEIVGMTDFGSAYTRTEVLADGWTKVDIGGVAGYIKSEFLSETSPDNGSAAVADTATGTQSTNAYFQPGDSIYLLTTVNVRSSMDENADKLGVAYEGETVKVVMEYQEGWTKINWSGKVGYVKTEFLK